MPALIPASAVVPQKGENLPWC